MRNNVCSKKIFSLKNIKKPKNLQDIIGPTGKDTFTSINYLLNLHYKKKRQAPILLFFKFFVVFVSIIAFVFGFTKEPTFRPQKVEADYLTTAFDEREALERQLKDLEKQIDEYEAQISSYQKQGKTLKNEIAQLENKIAKLNLQIKAINLTLKQLDEKIENTQFQIRAVEGSIANNRRAIAALIKNLYIAEQANLIEIFLKNRQLSDFFNDLNNIALVQGNLKVAIDQITKLRDELQEKKEQLSLAKNDAQSIQNYREFQKKEIDSIKKEKAKLLAVTKGKESEYQKLLKEAKLSAAQIRSRIFKLLGGGELSFEEAYRYAKLASDAVGVKPALILAVLDRESALGKNVGRCSYKTAMSEKNQEIFLKITKELNIDPDSVTVSCPNKDGIYGGAMGPAQFIPSTWMLYRERVSQITGNYPASPWNNADAFVATALYLKDAGASKDSSISEDRVAAAKYYAGNNWKRHLWTYGEAVVSKARQFEEDIKTMIAG